MRLDDKLLVSHLQSDCRAVVTQFKDTLHMSMLSAAVPRIALRFVSSGFALWGYALGRDAHTPGESCMSQRAEGGEVSALTRGWSAC